MSAFLEREGCATVGFKTVCGESSLTTTGERLHTLQHTLQHALQHTLQHTLRHSNFGVAALTVFVLMTESNFSDLLAHISDANDQVYTLHNTASITAA